MKQTQTMYYEAPKLELFEVKAEQGFAVTGDPNDFQYEVGGEN